MEDYILNHPYNTTGETNNIIVVMFDEMNNHYYYYLIFIENVTIME